MKSTEKRTARQVKVFDQCLDVLYQNLFSGDIILILQKIKLVQGGTKFVPPEFQCFEYRRDDSCVFIYFHAKQSLFLMQHLFVLNKNC